MKNRFRPVVIFVAVFFAFSGMAAVSLLYGAGRANAAEQKKSVVATSSDQNSPVKKWIAAENALIDPLNDPDKESFFILRNKYSVLRVIHIVERDVGTAVKSCADKNPDMKTDMYDRFQQWRNAVDPIIDTAKKQLDKDIDNQTIVDVKKAREVLKLNDEAYDYGDKQVTKQPVSTKDACQDLLKSMDRTEDQMVTLLQQTLLPESVIRHRSEELDKKAADKPATKNFSRKFDPVKEGAVKPPEDTPPEAKPE